MQFAKLCFPLEPEAHFCKMAANKNKNIYLQTKIKIFIAFLSPSKFWFSPTTCAFLASWTPTGKAKLCVASHFFGVVVPCTLFLEFCMAPHDLFFNFCYFFTNFASRSSGKHNSESRSYAKAQNLPPFDTRNSAKTCHFGACCQKICPYISPQNLAGTRATATFPKRATLEALLGMNFVCHLLFLLCMYRPAHWFQQIFNHFLYLL